MNTLDQPELQKLRGKEREGTLTPDEAKLLKKKLKMLVGPENNKMQTAPMDNK